MAIRDYAMGQGRAVAADYDANGDVLYIHAGEPRACYCDETPDGLLLRYGDDDEQPSGVTVIGFDQVWTQHRSDLFCRVADFLRVPTVEVEAAVLTASKNATERTEAPHL